MPSIGKKSGTKRKETKVIPWRGPPTPLVDYLVGTMTFENCNKIEFTLGNAISMSCATTRYIDNARSTSRRLIILRVVGQDKDEHR